MHYLYYWKPALFRLVWCFILEEIIPGYSDTPYIVIRDTIVEHMSAFKYTIVCFVIALSITGAFAQQSVSGKVIDEVTAEPLAFVNIILNHNVLTGTVSDVYGKFSYQSNTDLHTMTFTYVGYETKTIAIDSLPGDKPWTISLREAKIALGEIVVHAGENPANRIIRQVIANKSKNKPENLSSFSYITYNKVNYDFVYPDSMRGSPTIVGINDIFKEGYLLVMESVTERKFMQPDFSEERIRGVRVSGFNHPSFAPLATDVQSFSFYNEIIPLFDIRYLNPISHGSLGKYTFHIRDTLFHQQDTVFVLSYKPLPGKNFDALTGLLYINTNGYAIENVIASPFERGFIDIKIQQQYRLVDQKQWFPEQLNFELIVYPDSKEALGIRAYGVSLIDSVSLNPELRKRNFSLDAVRMEPLAAEQDSLFWNEYRYNPLDEREIKTYEVLDSLGEKYRFDEIMSFAEKLSLNKIPVGWVDIDISSTLMFNRYEGLRLGFGAYTNERLFENFSIGGFFGYGLKDYNWKYGGELKYTISKENETVVSAKYQNTIREVGSGSLNVLAPVRYDFRSWMASVMDGIQRSSIDLGFRASRYAKLNVAFSNTDVTQNYVYAFQREGETSLTDYQSTDVAFTMRYAFREKLIKSMGQRIAMGTKYPVLSISYTYGIKDLWGSDIGYQKLQARMEQRFYTKGLGETRYRIDAGWISDPIPYGLMFTGEGSYVNAFSILVYGYFQTITPYEFLSDRYVNLFFSHNFGSLLFHTKKFKPHFTISQNIGWGSLARPEYHQYVDFKTKENGLFESGLQIDNMIKINYLNIAYLGLGAGIYYRYGPYAGNKASDNTAYKFSMTFTTK